MCGIFGIFYHNSSCTPDENLLKQTAALLKHRGPDSCGVYAGPGIGLAHTRLSLLDLSARSNQPFWDKSRRYCLVYNGEIYNFRELKHDLEKQNVSFTTTSDTEVLLQGLIHNDIHSFLPKLEGMFAFAFFDKAERKLILARDRFGIKPLYVHESDECVIFSSEIKAMTGHVKFEPDLLSISAYLQGFGGPTKNHTFFKGIKITPPGSLVTLRRGGPAQYNSFFHLHDFWHNGTEASPKLDRRTAVDKVEELLVASVKKHLIADAPVGSLCSGGVDSSLVMAIAAKSHNNLAIFHANVKGPDSEYDAARLLSKHLKLDLKSVDVTDEDFIDEMPAVIEHYGYPFTYHPNSVPFLMVSRLVRDNGVKAVLSGEGSDECYLGYDFLLLEHPLMLRHRFTEGVRQFLRRIPKIRALIANGADPTKELVFNLHNRFEIVNEKQWTRSKLPPSNCKNVPDRTIRTLDLLNYHLRTLLHRNDCLGMAASIEARFPFLDHGLVQFAVNMPYEFKIRLAPNPLWGGHAFLRDKWVIRQVAARYLPPALSYRKKLGFPADGFRHMRISRCYFEQSPIAEIFDLSSNEMKFFIEHSDKALLTKLLHLDVWANVYLTGAPKDRILGKLKQHITLQSGPASPA